MSLSVPVNVLIRHELLRHEVIRRYSFPQNEFENSDEIAKQGFYYDKFSKRIYCFSCNFSLVHAPKYANLSFIHERWMKNKCHFLSGIDLSIRPGERYHQLVASDSISDNMLINEISNENFDYFLYSVQNPPIEKCIGKNISKILLKSFNSPMRIPHCYDHETLNVPEYFKLMKSLEMREKTFEIPNYYFNRDKEVGKRLASRGFFYTLFDGIVQCAWCGVTLTGINQTFEREITMDSIDHFHDSYTFGCKFLDSEKLSNPFQPPEVSLKIPDVTTLDDKDRKINHLEQRLMCIICCTKEREMMALPCNHLTACSECAQQSGSFTRKCLVCRKEITRYCKIFLS